MTLALAAESYAAQGWRVFPLRPRDKIPPAGFHWRDEATCDRLKVEGWWRREPNRNIGVAPGGDSGFWVLDLDGDEAEAALGALAAQHGALPQTVEQSTGKGRHLLFAWPEGRSVRNSAGKIGPKIDVRGEGGYIVAAPSIHPSGRRYAWRAGHGPEEMGLAAAPGWLLDLAAPIEAAPAPVARPAPRQRREGRASPYGEAALDNACRKISAAPSGKRDDTLYDTACGIGCLVGGEEIEHAYAFDALVAAGGVHVPAAFTQKALVDKVTRALAWGMQHPRSAPALERGPHKGGVAPAGGSAGPRSAGEAAVSTSEARALWDGARSAWCRPVTDWLEARGLETTPMGYPYLLADLRAHPRAPWGRNGFGPALLAPMVRREGEPIEAVAVLPLARDCERFAVFLGDIDGKVAPLTPLSGDAPLLVAVDLQDAWALLQTWGRGERGAGSNRYRAVVAPRLKTFAGGFLGDRYGRIDPATPRADPADPPWRLSGAGTVYLAMRRDVRSPELRARAFGGGTRRLQLEGEEAARFFGGLAEQAWMTEGEGFEPANAVRLIAPAGSAGFNTYRREGRA